MKIDKYLKTENKLNESYDLYNYMIKVFEQNRGSLKIGKWQASVTHYEGTVEWENPDVRLMVYATPFWEGSEGISVAVMNEGGEYEETGDYPMVLTGNPKKDLSSYLKVMKKVLSKVK